MTHEARDDAPHGSDLNNWFTYHPPREHDIQRYREVRAAGRAFAETVTAWCPPSAERDTAVEKIREAVFWANAAIACNPD